MTSFMTEQFFRTSKMDAFCCANPNSSAFGAWTRRVVTNDDITSNIVYTIT